MGKLKHICSILIIILLVSINILVYADISNNVIDEIAFLSDSEIEILQGEIEELKASLGHDIVIVITDNTNGKSSMAFADDYFDYNGYGIGPEYNGLLMLINMDIRELWISTTGESIDIFTDARISKIIDESVGFLKQEDYFSACNAFLGNVEHYINLGVPAGTYRVDESGNKTYYHESLTFGKKLVNNLVNPVFYIASVIISLIVVIIITLSSKGKITVNNRTYENKNAFTLTNRIDQFIYQNTTRRKIETNSSSGGGSSTHSGSSGRSHGGGGGSF